MNAMAENSLESPAPAVSAGAQARQATGLILASGDDEWCAQLQTGLAGSGSDLALTPHRLGRLEQLDAAPIVPGALWLVDEDWVAPLLARQRASTGSSHLPDAIVRFRHFSSARIIAVIESGARGCLSEQTTPEEALRAIRAVLAGELWLSRRLFSLVLAHVQHQLPDQHGDPDDQRLTRRQREIVACVARGMSNKQIGRQLGISPTTVKTHLHNIFERIGIGGRTLLALRAVDGELN